MIALLKAQIEQAYQALQAAEQECQAAAMEALKALENAELMRSPEKEEVFRKAADRHLQVSENWRAAVERQKEVLGRLHDRLNAALGQP